MLYNLFCWSYFTGRFEAAREYFRLMDRERGMCWWCDEDGCTELMEARGFLLMLDHKKDEALEAEMIGKLCAALREYQAPPEQWKRLGIESCSGRN